MSFLSGRTDKVPSPEPRPLGVDERRLSTNEQARPVPYFAGKLRVAVTFISDVFHIRVQGVTRSAGKQSTKIGNNYFASFAAMICHGPLDGIHAIVLNGETVWSGNLLRDVSNPDFIDLTIPDFGLARIYWGTETQEADVYLSNRSGIDHPAYRGIAYIVFRQLFFGFNQTNVQNVEVVVSRYPVYSWLPAPGIGPDVNPIHVIADLLQKPRVGLGLSESSIDTAALSAIATELITENIGISPWLTRVLEAKAILTQAFEYCDGYPITTTDGKFSVGLVRQPASPGTLLLVDEDDMTEFPTVTPEDWSTTINVTALRFTNGVDDAYREDAKMFRDRAAFQVSGQFNEITVDRSWVTNPELATAMVCALGRFNAVPKTSGQLRLKKTAALFAALAPGALFKLSYTPRSWSELICRVIERIVPDPARPEFTINFQLDRSFLTACSDEIVLQPASSPEMLDPDIEQLVNFRVVELPLALCPEGLISLAVLAARPDSISTSFGIYLAQNYDFDGLIADPENFDLIRSSQTFALHGTLTEAFDADVVDATEFGTGPKLLLDGVDLIIDEQSEFSAISDELLLFIDDEILSVSSANLIDTATYQLQCLRGRFATPIQDHALASDVFIIRRADLVILTHPHFDPLNQVVLKLRANTIINSADLATAPEIAHQITGFIYQQTPPANLRVNGDSANPTFSTGEGVTIDWTLTEAGRDHYQPGLLTVNTVLEFFDTSLVLLWTEKVNGGASTLTLNNSELVAVIGSEQDFIVRAKTEIEGDYFTLYSDSVELAVTLV